MYRPWKQLTSSVLRGLCIGSLLLKTRVITCRLPARRPFALMSSRATFWLQLSSASAPRARKSNEQLGVSNFRIDAEATRSRTAFGDTNFAAKGNVHHPCHSPKHAFETTGAHFARGERYICVRARFGACAIDLRAWSKGRAVKNAIRFAEMQSAGCTDLEPEIDIALHLTLPRKVATIKWVARISASRMHLPIQRLSTCA